ncbi:DISARM system phospholipase D-like protein DrmC [Embleya sp. NPDC005575]|uniref:DISARM system phospholipase D-like protein DrmC n=1 Tax=Embleya sp. NPDC005575 TaxID=3156892 RepID=UPI0033B8DBA6
MSAVGARTLPSVLARLVRRLPPGYRREWGAVLSALSGPTPDAEVRLLTARSGSGLAAETTLLITTWRREAPELPGSAIALALESAAAQYEAMRAEHDVQVVVTGPSSPAVPVRLTASVALDVIARARSSLLVVSFAAYGVRAIVEELGRAADRGVDVDLVLETSTDASRAFGDLEHRVRLWHWPRGRRTGDAALHAKLIAADSDFMLLGSANLTDRALADNIEVGLVLRDAVVVARVVDHFRSLMRPGRGPLEPVLMSA